MFIRAFLREDLKLGNSSLPGQARMDERLRERNKPQPNDLIFPSFPRELFNTILEEEGLKFDREGNRRTAYSLRHIYICLRLMEGADIYQIAKNCRTSVEMTVTYYASDIKTSINAAAVNVRRPRRKNRNPWKRKACWRNKISCCNSRRYFVHLIDARAWRNR